MIGFKSLHNLQINMNKNLKESQFKKLAVKILRSNKMMLGKFSDAKMLVIL